MQPIKELSSAAGQCAGRGCALIRQLANSQHCSANNKLHVVELARIAFQCVEVARSKRALADPERVEITINLPLTMKNIFFNFPA